ncbi:YoaK family protein [Nonomuraea maritima]|uniref:YoaK family protein n=1 Tax=Nonomuraea maritima TaxID=683260 RepID=UPI00371A338A
MGQIDGRSGARGPDAGAGGGSRQVPERLVPWMLLLLAASAGALDAVCLIRLGGLFASVITGNLVQLGRSVATVDLALLVGAVTSVGGYAVGVAVGSLGLRRPGRQRRGADRPRAVGGWGRRAGVVAAGEFVLLVAVAVGWVASAAWPPQWLATPLLGVGAAAMGVQSALSIESGAGSASTTYLTGTLTAVVRTLSGTPWRRSGVAGGVTRLAALLCGAAAGTVLLDVAQLYVVLLPVALVGTVAAVMLASTRRPRPAVRR